jgi:ferritin-like metal-binding protein YciE
MSDMPGEAIRDVFVVGLRNAHALENQALSIMEPQVSRLKNYPMVEQRLREHIEETKGQQKRLEEILSSLNESHSSLKDMGASFMGSMAAMGHSVAGDEILKNSFANFAFENFEIASYKSLITMAEASGQQAAIRPLTANLQEEERMAQWLQDNLREVTLTYLSREERGVKADR